MVKSLRYLSPMCRINFFWLTLVATCILLVQVLPSPRFLGSDECKVCPECGLTTTTFEHRESSDIEFEQDLVPRQLPFKSPIRIHSHSADSPISLKFKDDVEARVTKNGSVVSFRGVNLSSTRDIAEQYGVYFEQAHPASLSRIHSLELEAALRSGEAQPDMAGSINAFFVEKPSLLTMERVANSFLELQEVEYVYIRPLGGIPSS